MAASQAKVSPALFGAPHSRARSFMSWRGKSDQRLVAWSGAGGSW